MKRIIAFLLAGVLTGCGVELLTTTAIQGELAAEQTKALKGQMNWAADTAAEARIQHAINLYQAEKGHYPGSLAELVPDFLPNLPTRPDGTPYGYDPSTGKLLSGPVAAQPRAVPGFTPMSAEDQQWIAQIQSAIRLYADESGYLPTSLYSLVPDFLAQVPKTSSGQDFVYDPYTGAVYHPSAPAQTPAAPFAVPQQRPATARDAAVGGVGPMGEVMTGIGIQQELNSMSNAGTSAAGSRARQGIDGLDSQHTKQHERTLDTLGF